MPSPMMQQYADAKTVAGDALLLFRMGDFYELFFDDAKTAARVLGLTLTSRDKGENPIPMAGFPHHQLESYLGKLIAAGYRAAVCEQVEDPKQAKGLVRREVTRVVSRGTVTDDALLDPRASNFLAACWRPPSKANGAPQPAGLSWIDLSTGRFFAAAVEPARLADELARIAPTECLLPEDDPPLPAAGEGELVVTRRPPFAFGHQAAEQLLCRHFGLHSLEGLGFTGEDRPAVAAAGAVLEYLQETQRAALEHIDRLIPYRMGDALEIDAASRRSLELTRTLRDGRREGTLLWVLDRCTTPMGSRLLADWLAAPLTDLEAIERRLDAVGELAADDSLRAALRDLLGDVYDTERLLARVTTGRASPRDLNQIGRTLRLLPKIKAKLAERNAPLLNELEQSLDLCEELRARLEAALVEDCPLGTGEGGYIRPGYSDPLDNLRELAAGGKQWIARYQAEEQQRTGIPSLKVGFNSVFGYYLEVTNAHRDKVPPEYQRKQTLKNAERYITPQLKEYEERVLAADQEAVALELRLFTELRDQVQGAARRLQRNAALLATLDCLAALAQLARQRGYCRPQPVAEPCMHIIDGRHPVLDLTLPEGEFVPNDAHCSEEEGRMLLITGPNMAGKSTYIRQVALLTIMTQLGSFLPAREARVGVADRIFARVGASDHLAGGQSTFMVEMTETARILNSATERSLVILDEIGRGTSTYDGVSLAWAVVEHLHDRVGCRTFFATHYHELTELARSLPAVRNLNVAVREWNEEIAFLHKIMPGAADKSYGIHVARLAGIPPEVNERAKQILAQLEAEHLDVDNRAKIARREPHPRRDLQLTLFAAEEDPLLADLRALDLNALTPLDALNLLADWKKRVK